MPTESVPILTYVSTFTAICSVILSVTIRRSTLSQAALESAFEIQLGRFERRLKDDLKVAFVDRQIHDMSMLAQQKQLDMLAARFSRTEEHLMLIMREVLKDKRLPGVEPE